MSITSGQAMAWSSITGDNVSSRIRLRIDKSTSSLGGDKTHEWYNLGSGCEEPCHGL